MRKSVQKSFGSALNKFKQANVPTWYHYETNTEKWSQFDHTTLLFRYSIVHTYRERRCTGRTGKDRDRGGGHCEHQGGEQTDQGHEDRVSAQSADIIVVVAFVIHIHEFSEKDLWLGGWWLS